MKKILSWIFGIVGVLAIVTCVALAIKLPSTFSTLGKEMGLVNEKVDETSDKVQPLGSYVMDFTSVTNNGSGYKQSYITGQIGSKRWYCSSGNGASPDAIHPLSFILGWNDKSKVLTGSYDFYESIKPLVDSEKIDDGYKISYLLMDFDFYQNHNITFQVKPFEKFNDTSFSLISSKDNGSSWKIEKEIDIDNTLTTISSSFTSSNIQYRRYGLLLTSKLDSCRVEVMNFVANKY